MRWHHLDSVESTQTYIKRTPNWEPGTGVYSINQTQGHGRYDRPWSHADGSLAFSILIDDQYAVPTLWPTLAALSTLKSATEFLPEQCTQKLHFKWPNDLLINERKLSGCLVDRWTHQNKTVVLIGIGINLGSTPDRVANATGWIEAFPDIPPPTPTEFLNVWSDHLLHFQAMDTNQLITYAESKSEFQKGDSVYWIDPVSNAKLTGKYEGLGSYGELCLSVADNKIKKTNGSIRKIP